MMSPHMKTAAPTLRPCEPLGIPEIAVVDEHHQVLCHWARLHRESGRRLAVLTLDHHTDVLPAYGSRPQAGFCFSPEGVELAVAALHHDEHLDWALRSGICASCTVIAHENFTPCAHDAMEVICDPGWPEAAEIFAGSERARRMAERVLEADFLRSQLARSRFWGTGDAMPVLDIDLDYFLTLRALDPADASVWMELVRNAALITVSRERDWVRILRLPGENWDADGLLEQLLRRVAG